MGKFLQYIVKCILQCIISCIVVRDFLIKVLLQIYILETQGFRYISFCDDLTPNKKKKNLQHL